MPLIAGPDDVDAAMAPVPMGDPAAVDLKKLRIAFYTTNGQVDPTPELQATVRQTVAYFESLGVTSITQDAPPKMKELAEIRQKFNGADGREHIRRLLKLPGTTQASPGLNVGGDVVSSADFTRLCEEMDAIKSEQLGWFEKYDLIICPASNQAPVTLDWERPKVWTGASYTSQYNTTGWPAGVVRVATAEKDNLPLGIQVVGQPWRDDVVIAALSFIESKSGGYKQPVL